MSRRGENIYKRKDGRWEGRYKNGFKPDGSAKYSSVYGKTYAAVKASLLEKAAKSAYTDIPVSLTVKDLFESWLKAIKLKVKESSYMNYLAKYEKHILPALGGLCYDKLTAQRLDDFIAAKLSEGLSAKYVADIAGVIKSVCRFAHRQYGYADKSEIMSIPKGKSKEKALLNEDEQTALYAYLTANPSASNIGILLCMFTGLRIGELCALKWSDIDLDKRIIAVRHTMLRINRRDNESTAKTKLIITPPKSASSIRKIPLPDFIVPLLSALKSENGNYFLSAVCRPVEPRTMQNRFKSVLKRLNIAPVTFHSLRHLFATNCISIGFDVKTLSEILGHSSVEITLNRYVHSSFERKKECMRLLNERFIVA